MIAAVFLLQPFSIASPALATEPPGPNPADNCAKVIDGGKTKIKCTKDGKSVLFSFTGLYQLANGYLAGYAWMPRYYQFWSTGSINGEVYSLLVEGEPASATTNLKIQKVAIKVPKCDGVPANKNCRLARITTEGRVSGSSIFILETEDIGWDAIKPASGTSNDYIPLAWIANTTKGSATMPISDTARTAPTAAKMDECGKGKLTLPITAISGGVQKYVDDIKANWMKNITALPDGEDKTKATEVVNQMLGKAEDLYTKETDIELFKTFYDPSYKDGDTYPPKYPTVVVGKDTTDSVYSAYSDIAQAMSSDAANSNFDARNYMLLIGPVMKAGGISMYTLDKLPLWTVGGFGAIADGTVKWLVSANIADAKRVVSKQLKLYFAHLYLKNNLTFNKCVGAPFAFDTSANIDTIISGIDGILESSYGDLNAFGTDENKSECDSITGNFIAALVKKGFCGMLVMMKDFADWFFGHAKDWLSISLGVAENKSLETPADTDGSGDAGGGGTPGTGTTFSVGLKGGGVVKVKSSAILTALKATPSSKAQIIKYNAAGKEDGSITGSIAISASGTDSVKLQLTAPEDLIKDKTHPKFKVQFIANGKGYNFVINNTGTDFTLSGDAGTQIYAMSSPPTFGDGGGDTGGGTTSIKNQAIALCKSKKDSNAYNADAWQAGPCLIPNMNNTGYAVDIAHNPRIASDNTATNTCSGADKWVELDTSCAVIRTQPANTQ